MGGCAGSLVLVSQIGAIFAGIEALLCFLISAVCLAALAILAALKRLGVQETPRALVVKPRRGAW